MKKDMTTYTVRIPRSLRERMLKVDVEWSREIKRFIEDRVRVEMYRLAMKRIKEINSKFVGRGAVKPSWMLIREDRER